MSRQTTTQKPNPNTTPRTNGPAGTATTPGTPTRKPSADQIRKRAYELYLARRGVGGSPEQDWHQAERELTRELNTR